MKPVRELFSLLKVERYVGRTVIAYTFLVWAVLLLLMGFIELSIQLGKLQGAYTLDKALLYVVLKMPVYGYDLFPLALLIGMLMGLGQLANQSELIILRVSGWSVSRIFAGVAKSVLLLALLAGLVGEWLAPRSELWATQLRSDALHRDMTIGEGGIWLRQQTGEGTEQVIHVRRPINDRLLADVTVYTHRKGRLETVLHARYAHWEQDMWRLEKVSQQRFLLYRSKVPKQKEPVSFMRVDEEKLPVAYILSLVLTPERLGGFQVQTRYLSLFELWGYIDFLKENAVDARPYVLALWRKLTLPLTLLAMMLIVFPLVFGSTRQVSMGQRIFIGVMIGLTYHFVSQLAGNLTLVYDVPVIIGVLVPPLLLGGAGVWGIMRMDRPYCDVSRVT